MSAAKRLFDFYLDASIHVALAIFALARVTSITLNIPVDSHLCWFLFFGSISCYNFVKYGVEAEKYIMVADPHQRHIQWVSFVALAAAFYHGYFLSIQVYIAVGVLVVLTGLYAVPVLPNTKNLRNLGGLKIFVVALVWAGATVLLPVMAVKHPLSWNVQIEVVQRFLFVLILLIPFEVRDLAYDNPDLRTLPQRFGVNVTKIMGFCATLPFFLLSFLKDNVTSTELMANAILLAVLMVVMGTTRRNQNRYFATFWVEAVPIFWWGLLLALSPQF
ncbi:MAG: hypothetical protein WA913_16970 [Pricia sp.]